MSRSAKFTGVFRVIGHQGDGEKKGSVLFMYEGEARSGEPVGFGRILKYYSSWSQAFYNSGFIQTNSPSFFDVSDPRTQGKEKIIIYTGIDGKFYLGSPTTPKH